MRDSLSSFDVGRVASTENEYTLSQLEMGGGGGLALPAKLRIPAWRALGAAAAFVVTASVVTWRDGLDWSPDRALLVLALPAVILGRTRRFLLDFVPFALLIVIYAECRGLAHVLSPHPYYRPQIWLEQHIFGVIPAVWLQAHFWHGHMRWYDHVAATVLNLHFAVPPTIAFALWLKRRMLFYRFATSIVVLSFASAIVFAVFPSAPPWAAAQKGVIHGVVKLPPVNDVSSLGPATHALANPYAAIPSLHAGYAFLVALTIAALALRSRIRFRRTVAGLCFLYPLAAALAVIYTGNHYVVDIVVGCAFATAAFLGTERLFRRYGWS